MKTQIVKMRRLLAVIVLTFISAFIVAGCSDSKDNPVDGGNNPAKIEGKVTDSQGFNKLSKTSTNISGAAVTLVRIKSDGTFETVSDSEAVTGSDGKFTLTTKVSGESDLMIVAKKGDKEWHAIVTSQVNLGMTVYAQPLNDETTAESEVYAQAKEKNYNDVHYSDIAVYIDADIAAEIKGNTTLAENTASAIKAQVEAQKSAAMSATIGATEAQWNTIRNAQVSAQAQLERDLYYAQSSSAVDAAEDSYYQASADAFVSAGLSLEAYGKLMEISNRTFVELFLSNFPDNLFLHFAKKMALIKARATSFAVNARFEAMNASSTILNSVKASGLTLRASIRTAANLNGIVSAFDDYHTAVVGQLSSALAVDASVITGLETQVAGFKTTLKLAVMAATTTQAIVDAYAAFYQSVKNAVDTALENASSTEITATADILILINSNF